MSNATAEPVAERPAATRAWHRKFFGSKFLFISVAVHLLFGCLAAYVVVQRYQASRKLTFKAGPPSPNPSTRAIEHKVQMARKQSTMSAPSVAKRITTTGLSKVALPEMPAMPKLAAPPVKMAGAGGADVSFNAGGMTASSGSGAGGAAVPFFGFRESKGGGALSGHFYDLKQLKNGTPSKLDEKEYPNELKKFVNSGWNPANLERFFVGPNPLYTTQIFIPSIDANQGPLAFGLGGRVQPKMWVVHYKGNVVPTESGTFHFVGVGDDVLVVRFNNRVVLDAGFCSLTDHQPSKFYSSVGLRLDPKMGFYKGLGQGDPIQVSGGQSYPIDILIGEWPGGQFKVYLMLEKEGVQYEKDAKGNPILPIFKLADSTVAQPASEAPPFAKQGPVWKAEKAKDDSASVQK
jgi:hypothetical protein